jgi:aspartyl-tRNA(Asn)/glutamyl-tRNA(Gln) amidotransferase subunit A
MPPAPKPSKSNCRMMQLRHRLLLHHRDGRGLQQSRPLRRRSLRSSHRQSQRRHRSLLVESREEGFGPEVKRRIMLGTYALSSGYYDAYYLRAMKVRTLLRRDFAEAFERCDVICSPVTPSPAFRIGEKIDDPLAMYLADIYTISVNLAGIPSVSVPCGFSREGLPIGMQLMGPALAEDRLLAVAHQYQQRTDHHLQRPD